jgi:hypothetical protein
VTAPSEESLEDVRFQQKACRNVGSPFYTTIFESALTNADIGHPFWRLLESFEGRRVVDLPALRFLGALHDLVLAGRAPALALHYPSVGGDGDAGAVWSKLDAAIEEHADFITARLGQQIQTNEVRRCAVLMPGFMVVNARAQLPMRLAEIGASAGLNLCWDRYRYQLGDQHWGDPESPVSVAAEWSGGMPTLGGVEIASRGGCDLSPLDVTSEEDRRRLRSFVWPDQLERFARLDDALALARSLAPSVVRSTAGDFVDETLSEPAEGRVTVIYHSIMWMYVPQEERERIESALRAAGEAAGPEAPLAWLRMEFVDEREAGLFLDYWPGGESQHLARCHYHGTSVEWLG